MEPHLLLWPFWAVFLCLNAWAVASDLRSSRIPNAAVIGLLALWGIGAATGAVATPQGWWWAVAAGGLAVVFWAYAGGRWGAGDAKYAFVLWLFAFGAGPATMVGNVGLVFLAYATLVFLKTFLAAPLFSKAHRGKVLFFFREDLGAKFGEWIGKAGAGSPWQAVARGVSLFFAAYLTLRLGNMYVSQLAYRSEWVREQALASPATGFLVTGATAFVLAIMGYRAFSIAWRWMEKRVGGGFMTFLKTKGAYFAAPTVAAAVVVDYLTFDPGVLSMSVRFLTVSLAIWAAIRTLRYAMNAATMYGERETVPYERLAAGMYVDHRHLDKTFGQQACLGYDAGVAIGKPANPELADKPLHPDPGAWFRAIRNPIDEETAETIKRAFVEVEKYLSERGHAHLAPKDTGTFRTFPFAPYLFAGFALTATIGDAPARLAMSILFRWIGGPHR